MEVSAIPPFKYGEIKYGSGKKYGQVAEIYSSENITAPSYSGLILMITPNYNSENINNPTYS